MNLTFGQPLILIVGATLLAASLTYWLYRSNTPDLSSRRRWSLGLLRWSALTLILFLLGEPILKRIIEHIRPPVVAVLLDTSQSMTLAFDDSKENLDDVADRVTEIIDNTVTDVDVRRFAFGASTRNQNPLDSLRLTAGQTDIGKALEFLESTLGDENFSGAILLSDGRNTVGRNPQRIAETFPVPIVTVTLGDTTIQRDIRIQRVLTNELAYTGSDVPFRVRIRNEGFTPTPVAVSLVRAGETLTTEQIRLPESGREVELDLTTVPDEAGLFQYAVVLTRLDGEATHRNNRETVSLQVLDRKRKILMVAGGPSPDVAAIRRMVESDTDTEVTTRVQKRGGTFYEGPLTKENFDGIDLLLLIGYPSGTSDVGTMQLLAAQIENDVPYIFFMDRQIDLQQAVKFFGEYLPSSPVTIRTTFGQGSFVPVARGLDHSVFDIPDRNDVSGWMNLPPLDINETRWQARLGSEILATTKIRGIQLDDPVLLIERRHNSRSAMWLGNGMWKWSNISKDLAEASDKWKMVFSNLVQWALTARDDRPVRVQPAKTRIADGTPVQFSGQVYDENSRPVSDADIKLNVRNQSGEVFPYSLRPVGSGQYELDLGSLPEGTYSYQAEAHRAKRSLGTDSGVFSVGALAVEFRDPHSDLNLMKQIAKRSNGASIVGSRLSGFAKALKSLDGLRPVREQIEEQERLWRKYAFLIAIVILLSVEWFLRKRFGLV